MPHADRKTRLEYQRNLRDKRRKQGICTRCAGPRDNVYMDCSICRKKGNALVLEIIRRNLHHGLCACGKPRIKKKLVCKKCANVSRCRQQELKKKVIKGYGGKCTCCGQKQWEFLSVDHKKNDGAERRRRLGRAETSATLYRRLIAENFPPDYQILCYNCNLSLGFFGYCPHHPKMRRSTDKKFYTNNA